MPPQAARHSSGARVREEPCVSWGCATENSEDPQASLTSAPSPKSRKGAPRDTSPCSRRQQPRAETWLQLGARDEDGTMELAHPPQTAPPPDGHGQLPPPGPSCAQWNEPGAKAVPARWAPPRSLEESDPLRRWGTVGLGWGVMGQVSCAGWELRTVWCWEHGCEVLKAPSWVLTDGKMALGGVTTRRKHTLPTPGNCHTARASGSEAVPRGR